MPEPEDAQGSAQRSRPIPASYYGKQRRGLSIVLGIARIVVAVGTVPLSIEMIKQGNVAGDGWRKFITFFWSEAVVYT